MSILICIGTRPEIIKMAPIIHGFKERNVKYKVLFTGQHYDYEMCSIFIKELDIKVDYSLKLRGRTPLKQLSEILAKFEIILRRENVDLIFVQGDTNSVLATGIAANKLNIKLGHIEAGLRSFDLRMPEEHNRRIVDHISNFLFAPTLYNKRNLLNEKVWGKIFVTGNTVIDAIANYFSKTTDILKKIKFEKYTLATIHRKENVDNKETLDNFVKAFLSSPLPIVLPLHPSTKKRLIKNNLFNKLLNSKYIQVLPPVGYGDFITLMKKCEIVLTDSGGVQEEATSPLIRKPIVVLRESTERPEAVEYGFAEVVGTRKKAILRGIKKALRKNISQFPLVSPFGKGDAGRKIVDIVLKNLNL